MSDQLKDKGFTTRLVHADRILNSPEDGSVHSPVNSSVLFNYPKVEDLVDIFQGKVAGHAYARTSSSSQSALQNIMTHVEGGKASLAFASGMAAISATILSLLEAGDHLIASRFVFGNTATFLQSLKRFGIEVTLVDVTDVEQVKTAKQDNTRMVFLETIANPVTQVADLKAIGEYCDEQQIVYLVDNTMTPASILNSQSVKASLVVNSLTKYIAGHGNALGGIVVEMGNFKWSEFPRIESGFAHLPDFQQVIAQIKKRGLRDMGGCISGQSAHLVSVGVETLALRTTRFSENALALAQYLDAHPKVKKVYYPGLESHPQHQLAKTLFCGFGGILSIDLQDDVDCFAFMNRMKLVLNATHLGDTRTLGIPVAHTIFYDIAQQEREKMGISQNMIRYSIGIEDSKDLIADFEQALA